MGGWVGVDVDVGGRAGNVQFDLSLQNTVEVSLGGSFAKSQDLHLRMPRDLVFVFSTCNGCVDSVYSRARRGRE